MLIQIKKNNLINKLIYLTIISGFFGASFFSIPFGPITLFPYRILIMFLLIFVSLGILKNKKIYISHIKVKNYLFFLLFWFIYAIFSLGWAKIKIAAVREIGFLIFALSIVFLVVYFFRELNNYNWFYKIWILVLVFMIILGFWEVITGNHLATSKLKNAPLRFKHIPTGVYANQNDFATYLTLSIPFLLSLIKYKKNHKKIIGYVLLFSSLYLIILTGSRANIIALIIGIIFWFLFNLDIKNKVKYIFFTFIIFILIFVFYPKQIVDLLNEIEYQISSVFINYSKIKTEGKLGSIGIRINLIKNSLKFVIESFGFGVGAGNAEYYMKTKAVYDTRHILNVHNWWFEILTNYGIFIFIGYILFYLGVIKELFKISKISKKDSYGFMISETLLTSMMIFLIASISSSSILAFKPQWLLFAFSIGFINYFRLNYNL
jgi:teichuronic acid biosynthesis protein TuaE